MTRGDLKIEPTQRVVTNVLEQKGGTDTTVVERLVCRYK
jgi:hypothetical protein